MTSFTDAIVCPKCGLTGRPSGKRRHGRTTLHIFTCENARCRWFQTEYLVGTNPDGSVQERESEPRGSYEERLAERRRRQIIGKQYTDRLEEELQNPTGPGTLR